MIGDNYELDVIGPRGIGLASVHLDRSRTHPGPERWRIAALNELPGRLDSMARDR